VNGIVAEVFNVSTTRFTLFSCGRPVLFRTQECCVMISFHGGRCTSEFLDQSKWEQDEPQTVVTSHCITGTSSSKHQQKNQLVGYFLEYLLKAWWLQAWEF